jgi:hypothetical protein
MRRPKRLRIETLDDRCLPSFTPVASYAVGPYTGAVVSADFDNDNVPDLAANTGEVLLGNGDGTFHPAPNSGIAGGSIAVGDFDGDGNLDLAATTYSSVTVLMGQGDGTFVAAGDVPVSGGDVSSVAVGDFTGDGLLDLGVTSNVYFQDGYDPYYGWFGHYEGSVDVLVGNGAGEFSGPNTTALGYGYLSRSAVADFNGDGIDDLAATNQDTSTISVLLGDASGFLQNYTGIYTGSYVYSMTAADVDGDLDADLVTADYGGVTVLLGDETGGFGNPQYYAGGGGYSVTVTDFNGDSKPDIATTSYFVNNTASYTGYVTVALGKGDGTFHTPIYQYLDPGPATFVMNAADFDGDGLPDVAVTGTVWSVPTSLINVLHNAGDWVVPTTLTVGDATVTEGDSGTVEAVFNVQRGDNLDTTVTVNYSTANADALAGSDYVATSGTLTFGPGETTKEIRVLVNGDRTDEYDQHFSVNLTSTGAVVVDGQGVGTILDNDPPPTMTITPKVSAKEGNNTKNNVVFTFVVTLSAASEKEVRVNYSMANGTATTADNDYVARAGTLIFSQGQTTKNIAVTVKGDKKKEANETFFVNLSDATNATLVGSQGVGEILNDDPR